MGGAIKTGIMYGLTKGYSHAISLDSDGQHSPIYIDSSISKLADYDFIIGNRLRSNSVNEVPTSKLSSNFMGTAIVSKVFDVPMKDISCGYRGFKLSKDLFQFKENRFGFVFEQLLGGLAMQIRFSTIDMPATYQTDNLSCTRCEEILAF